MKPRWSRWNWTNIHLNTLRCAHVSSRFPQKPVVTGLMLPLRVRLVSIIGMRFYSSIIGCLVMQGGRTQKWPPHFPPLSLLSKPPPSHPLPSIFFPFFLSLLSFCFPLARGLCQRQAKVEQALFSSSESLVVLASKERGPIDEKGNNAPNGVHVNIIKRCHVWWSHRGDSSAAFDAKLTNHLSSNWLEQHLVLPS